MSAQNGVCPKCLKAVPADSKFCTWCGEPLPAELVSRVSGAPEATQRVGTVAEHEHPSAEMKKCPFCAEEIHAEAIVCPHCRRDLIVTQPSRRKRPAGRNAAFGAGFLVLSLVVNAIPRGRPTTQMEALLPGLIGGLLAWAAIIFFIVAIVQAVKNRKAEPAGSTVGVPRADDVEMSTGGASAASAIPAASANTVSRTEPLFLHIPVARLILMSIVSFGIYQAYWVFRNWRYVKERDNLEIRPFWRGVFCVLFCHSLLRRIHEDKEARAVQAPSFSPGVLATGWVILVITANLVSRVPGTAATMVAAFIPSFLLLVPVQNYVNSVTVLRNPDHRYYPWSWGHILCLVVGLTIWALLVFGPRA